MIFCICRSQSCESTPVGLRKNIRQLFRKNKIIISDDSTTDGAESDEEYKTSHDNSDASNEDYIEDKDYSII